MFSPLLADSVNNVTHTPWLPEQRSPLAFPKTRPPDKMCYSVLICVFYWFSFQTINCWERILDNAGIICQSRSLINGTAIGKGSLAIRKYIARILNVAPSLLSSGSLPHLLLEERGWWNLTIPFHVALY